MAARLARISLLALALALAAGPALAQSVQEPTTPPAAAPAETTAAPVDPAPGVEAPRTEGGVGSQVAEGFRRTGATLAQAGRAAGRTLAGWWGRSADTVLSFVDDVGFAISRLSP
jgi:hypothetical protein